MKKTREILRLSLKEGLSQREIAQSTGVGKTTVQEILANAAKLGFSWEQVQAWSESQMVQKLFYNRAPTRIAKELHPPWAQVKLGLMEKGVTLSLLWMEYKVKNPEGLQYSRFCELYRQWEKQARLALRQQHLPGEKLFVDFSGLTVPWLDLATGEIKEAQVFVACLGASNFTFAAALPDQSLPSWAKAHVQAFEFFGGVPRLIVPDNLKAGVTRACRYDPDTNPTYLALAEHYGTAVLPTRAGKPRDKAKVEVAVQVVQRWILAILRRQTFTSIEQINAAIEPLLCRLNDKIMRHLGASRREIFEKHEKKHLSDLPEQRFESPVYKKAKVNIDYHVEFERHYYSVPFSLVSQVVMVRATENLVEILFDGNKIVTHKRHKGVAGRHTTLTAHMPPKHSEYVKWTPERILQWATTFGGSVKELCDAVLASRPHPEQGFRACLGILRLGDKYGKRELEIACSRALKIRGYQYKTIELFIKEAQAGTKSEKAASVLLPAHHNIRGPNYYQ